MRLNRQQQQQVWDALAVAAYHAQTGVPVLPVLLSDDAAVYDHLTETHALCWVHAWRHYAKLRPQVPHHQALLDAFRTDYWAFYRELLAYREAPSQEERARLADAFDTLVDRERGYEALDDRIVKTADKRAQLLAVLEHPDIPLHYFSRPPCTDAEVRAAVGALFSTDALEDAVAECGTWRGRWRIRPTMLW